MSNEKQDKPSFYKDPDGRGNYLRPDGSYERSRERDLQRERSDCQRWPDLIREDRARRESENE